MSKFGQMCFLQYFCLHQLVLCQTFVSSTASDAKIAKIVSVTQLFCYRIVKLFFHFWKSILDPRHFLHMCMSTCTFLYINIIDFIFLLSTCVFHSLVVSSVFTSGIACLQSTIKYCWGYLTCFDIMHNFHEQKFCFDVCL